MALNGQESGVRSQETEDRPVTEFRLLAPDSWPFRVRETESPPHSSHTVHRKAAPLPPLETPLAPGNRPPSRRTAPASPPAPSRPSAAALPAPWSPPPASPSAAAWRPDDGSRPASCISPPATDPDPAPAPSGGRG